MRVKPGTALRLWSDDAFCGVLRSVDDLSSEKIDLRFVNPQTGPFYVEGAEPGDTLVLHFVDLEPARDWGASAAIPFFGGMTSTDRDGHPAGRPARHHLDLRARPGAGTVTFAARHSEHRIELPVAADARHGRRRSGGRRGPLARWCRTGSAATWTPRRCGPARRCYLGVNVEGALFSIGDGHYRQGEGEACGTAVEGAMTTTLIVDLVKGGAPGWPRIEDDTHWMTVGSSRPLEDAWRVGNAELVALGRRALRAAHDGRLPAVLPDRGGADRQRRRRQLQRRGQGRQGPAPPRPPPSTASTPTSALGRVLSGLPDSRRPDDPHPPKGLPWTCSSAASVSW